MTQTLDAVIARLEARGLGIGGQTIFAGSDVDLPVLSTAFLNLVPTGGRGPLGTHNAGTLRQPSLMVTARGDLYPGVLALIDAAYLALGGGDQPIVNLAIGEAFFLWMHPTNEPMQLPVDGQGRNRLVFDVASLRR